MKKTLLFFYSILILVGLTHCRTAPKHPSSNNSNVKNKENYLANEASKAIEYNKNHKTVTDKKKEKLRKEEEANLKELNKQKHQPAKDKKKEEGQFKMY